MVDGANVTAVAPTPGQATTVRVCISACDDNGVGDLTSVTASLTRPNTAPEGITLAMENNATAQADCLVATVDPDFVGKNANGTCDLYSGTFTIASTEASGDYAITATATDANQTSGVESNILAFGTCSGVQINQSLISFGNVAPGQSSSPMDVVLTNICNTPIDIEDDKPALDRTGGGDTIPASSISETLDGALPIVEAGVGECFDADLAAGLAATMTTTLSVPLATLPGTYSGTKVLTALAASICEPGT